MDLLRVVLKQLILLITAYGSRRLSHVAIAILAAYHETHLAAGVCGDGRPGVVSNWEDALALFLQRLDDVHVQPRVLA